LIRAVSVEEQPLQQIQTMKEELLNDLVENNSLETKIVAYSIITGKKFKDFTDQRVKDPQSMFPSLFKSKNPQSSKSEEDKSLMAKI
jgi:hypothetical protein